MRKIFRLVLALVVSAGLFITSGMPLLAQSNALTITPRKDYTLQPGQTVTDTLNVTNQDRVNPLRLRLIITDFTSQDESGSPKILEENAPRTAWSLKDYIRMPEQVVIEAGATSRIPITLEMPADIGAGSYYSAIEYSAVTDAAEDKVNISASGVTLMFVKVPGQMKQLLVFEQFGAFVQGKADDSGSFAGIFFGERPKVMAYRLRNEGNVAESPNAAIEIKNFSGETVYTVSDANPKEQLALRGQTRRFEACIVPETVQQTTDNGIEVDTVVCGDTNFKPGRYTAELTILYGENGNETREITAKATFWYLPWWFVGLIVLAIALIIGAILYIKGRVSQYRSRKTRRR
jgi:hypothetical protein